MVRVSAELIWTSPHFFNAVKERELDLRGNKIPQLENLGATEDQFDCIDVSDNEIVKLDNLPSLTRLTTLILNNNRVTRITPRIGVLLPRLHSLVLTNNRLVNLRDIDPLASLPRLHLLSLLDNAVTKKPSYRLYAIHTLAPSLRLLDFNRVRARERADAAALFAADADVQQQKDAGVAVAEEEDDESEDTIQAAAAAAPTPEQITAIKAAIVNAQTLEEVARLEKALNAGQLPVDFMDQD